jgi:hypothetical protein
MMTASSGETFNSRRRQQQQRRQKQKQKSDKQRTSISNVASNRRNTCYGTPATAGNQATADAAVLEVTAMCPGIDDTRLGLKLSSLLTAILLNRWNLCSSSIFISF